MKISDILAKAADLIEPEGRWQQHGYGDGDFPTCMGGAVNLAEGRRTWNTEPYAPVVDFLNAFVGGRGVGPWNDAPERTQPEVVAKLREAATVAKERGL